MVEESKFRRRSYALCMIFCALAIGIGLGGYHYYQGQKDHIKRHESNELLAIADLKVYELLTWRKERIGDGAVITRNPMIADEIKRWLSDPSAVGSRQRILTWMESFQAAHNYKNALLIGPDGTIRLPTPQLRKVDRGILEWLPQAVETKAPLLSELYRSEDDNTIHLDVLAPILDWEQEDRPVIGILVLQIDPYDFVFPYIQRWPAPSETSETLLVRREGDEVVFLNELRHLKDSALNLRLPLSRKDLPAAMAAQGKEGVVEAIDYRGVPVLASFRTIPDSPWSIIAKVDAEEIYAPIRERARLIAIFAGLMMTGAALGIALIWSQQRAQQFREQREVIQKARDELDLKVKERTADLVKVNGVLQEQAALLELAHDAIVVRDLHARVIYWNRGAEQTYGWNKSEAGAKIVHELLKTQFAMPLEEIEPTVLETGGWEGELLQITRDGSQIQVESRWALQRDEDGIPTAMLEVNRDITRRKMAESSLKQYAHRLEQSNRVLKDFAFVASHDLQEPLRKIRSFGERLGRRFAESLGDEGRDYIERMRSAADRMQTLIESLLMYSRVTTRTEPFVSVDLHKVVEDVLVDLEVSINETGGRVEVGELPNLEADPDQMRQLFQNLIGNGLKFHGERKPVVKIYSKPWRNETWEILVEDNGIGFDEKYLDQIFVPFQRLHGKNSPYKGSGMGLAICRKIVDRHDGDITAKGALGKGSTFIITLPLKQCCSDGLKVLG